MPHALYNYSNEWASCAYAGHGGTGNAEGVPPT